MSAKGALAKLSAFVSWGDISGAGIEAIHLHYSFGGHSAMGVQASIQLHQEGLSFGYCKSLAFQKSGIYSGT
jgi:hypothetical protein